MTIFDVLKQDHRAIGELFERIDAIPVAEERKRAELFEALKTKLAMHAELEDSLLYGILRELEEGRPDALEANERTRPKPNDPANDKTLSPFFCSPINK